MYILEVFQNGEELAKLGLPDFSEVQDMAKKYPDADKFIVEDQNDVRHIATDIQDNETVVYNRVKFTSLDDILAADPDDPFVVKE